MKTAEEKREFEVIKYRIIRNIRFFFEPKKKRVDNFYSNYYTEYGSNGDKNKTLLIKECFDKIRPYLKDVMKNLKKSDKWNI